MFLLLNHLLALTTFKDSSYATPTPTLEVGRSYFQHTYQQSGKNLCFSVKNPMTRESPWGRRGFTKSPDFMIRSSMRTGGGDLTRRLPILL